MLTRTAQRLGNLGGVHPIGDSQGNVGVGGQDWELFVGFNGAMKVFSFVAPEPVKTFEEDLRPFFDHITSSQDFPANDQHLISMKSPISLADALRKLTVSLQRSSLGRSLSPEPTASSMSTTGTEMSIRRAVGKPELDRLSSYHM